MSTTTQGSGLDLIRKIRSLPAKRQRALIAMLKQQGVDLSALDTIARLPRSAEEPVQLSFTQQRLWFLAQLDGTSAAYNIPMATRLRGHLDRPALLRALAEVVQRHEALRTRFVDHDGVPYQLIGDGRDIVVGEEELADPADLPLVCAREAAEPFDLEHDPLIRVRLLRQSEQEHVLLVTMHHGVSDGWSVGVLVRDLIALYGAFSAGLPSPLQPLPVQYADYAHWQREWLAGDVRTRQVEYWKKQLAGVDPRLSLPADRERPAVKTYHGARESFRCPAELLERLREVGKEYDVTLYMTLLAAYSLVLHRYTNQSEIAVGTVVANRNRIEVEGLIGFFANTLVMCADLSGDPTFPELLAQVKRTALDAYDHQDVPFEAVVDALQLERSLSHSPVFQTMLVLQEAQTDRETRLGDLEVSPVEFDVDITKFDVTLDLRETPDGLLGTVEYNTDLFDRATVRRFIGHFTELLASVAADPTAPASRLAMTGAAERRQVLEEWNDTRRPYSDDRCLHQLFEDEVRRHPGRTALVDAERSWSYAELNAWANRIGHALRARGVGPDSLVGLSARRSAEMVAGILGALKAGGAYMPIEPSYPADRIAELVEVSGVQVVLTQPDLDQEPLKGAAHLLTLHRDGAVRDRDGEEAAPRADDGSDLPAAGLGPEHLAYVIHTSGSTGRPKGVMIEHRAAVNRIEWMQNEYRLTEDDVVLQKTPYSFDVSVWEFFWPLLFGARLAVAEPDGHKDPAYLVAAVQEFGVTTLHFVPSMLRSIVEEPGWSRCTSVRQVFCSGEALPAELCARHHERHPALLHNLYGPTEAAVDVSHWTCPPGPAPRTVPIGRPIQNIQLHVLNEALEPQGIGCVGQLYIAGDGLARGYLHQPELTRERFVPNPFAGDPAARMYRTGDLARRLPDGALEYLGRIDDQVKLRGFRIEPGEIEHRLTEHPAVRSCAVVVREDQPGNPRLVAYTVLADEPALADHHGELTRHLEQSLPEYMVPGAFVVLDALPVTAHGKLDRRALPAPDIEAFAQRAYTAPRTATERLLAGLWAELLGFEEERVGADDNFFALGGHSLLITVLVARLKAAGLRATVRAVFGAPTLAGLATSLDAAQDGTDYSVPPNPIGPGCERITPELLPLITLSQEQIDEIVATVPGGAPNVQDVYPLVSTQEGILFHHLMDPSNDPYLVSTLYVADDEGACAAFGEALQALVDRHDVMRTAVLTAGLPEPVQVVHRSARPAVERVRLDPDADAEQQARELLGRPAPLALDRAPLLRLVIAEDPGSERRYLLLTAHHLIEDATSLRLTLQELGIHMAGRAEHLEPAPPYRDFVAHTLHQPVPDVEAHFRSVLGDVTEPTTPFGLTDVRGDARRMRQLRRPLPPGLTRDLRAQAQRLRISPAGLFHAAWACVVAATSGRDDVVFGTVLSGRLQGVPGVERMLGNFINTLPLRARLAGRTVRELIADVDAGLQELIVREQSPLGLVQRCSGLDGDAPLFSAVVNFRHFEAGHGGPAAPRIDDRGVRFVAAADGINYPLTVSLDDFGTELSLDILVDEEVACEAVADHVETALSGIVGALAADDGAGTAALDIEVLPATERRRLLTTWSGPVAAVPDASLPELIERQAARSPEAVAVSAAEGELTYAELNERANRLARVLLERGVGPGGFAGVVLPRGIDLIVAFVAVLKAGAAYLPIDPEYPQERIDFILDDTRPVVVLTDRATAPALHGALLELDAPATRALLADAAADNPGDADRPAPLTRETPAYVVYTSGSTGRPKGVVLPARVLANLLDWSAGVFPAEPGSRVSQFSAVSFDMSEYELLNALLQGKTLCVPGSETRLDPAQLAQWLERERITEFFAPNLVIAAVYEAAVEQGLRLDSLRHVLQAGEALQLTTQVREFHAARPLLRLHNQYGPSETHVVTAATLPADVAEWPAAAPLGRPIQNTRAYVLDQRLRPAPVGVAGELHLAGDGLAHGYLNRSDLTAQRFLDNPFGEPGERMYRTGDVARWRGDGTLEYLGRADDQVKVRGFRVEPGEIENALHAHPAVHSAVVLPRESGNTRTLVAYTRPTPQWLDAAAEEQNAGHLDRWRQFFEERYADARPAPDPSAGGAGRLDAALRAVEALRPERVLEIGCGTGELLLRYAQGCASVHAVDLSAAALDHVRRGVEQRGWSHVTLSRGDALSVADLPEGGFDTIVLDSVVQYFPNRPYLERTIAGLLPLLEEGGRILLGGVRDLDLFAAELCAAERARADAAGTAGALAEQVQRARREETGLLVSPSWFARLTERFPELAAVDLPLRRDAGPGGRSAYGYDVVLTKGAAAPAGAHPWLEAATPARLRALLDGATPDRFGVSGLTDPRVAEDVAISEGLARRPAGHEVEPLPAGSALSEQAAADDRELEAVLRHAEDLGYRVAATRSQNRADGLDLVFGRGELPPVRARAPYRASHLANSPQLRGLGPAMARMLKEHLSARLPDYMVPGVFVVLDELPVTPNGKVDKRALPAPHEDDLVKEVYVAPRTEAERTLCRIVEEVLGISSVGLQDTFFDLGGHSLLATRLTLRVRKETGLELPLQLVFNGATVAELAEALEREPAARESIPLLPAVAAAEGEEAPLSLQQKDLWFLGRPEHLGTAYDNVQMAFRIDGPLDRDAYTRSVLALVERHAVLRTGYVRREGVVTQRVNGADGFAVTVLPVADEDAVAEWLRAERLRPFAPEDRHPLRVHLLARSEQEHVVVLTRPWGIFDGWSVSIVLSELLTLYRALSGSGEPLPEPLPLQYADYARWQSRAVGAPELERQQEYWRRQLDGLPACLSLRADYPRCPVKSYQGAAAQFQVPLDLLTGLQRLGQERGVTLYMTLLSAFAVLLGGRTEDRELAIGSPVTNRSGAELEQLVGYFVNTVVMRLDVAPDRAFTEVLTQARQVTAEAHEQRDLPFVDLVRALVPEPDPSHSPLFQAAFNLIPAPVQAPRAEGEGEGGVGSGGEGGDGGFADLAVRQLHTGSGTAKYDLNLVVQEAASGLHGYLEYSTDLFARGTAESLAGSYERLLRAIVAQPEAGLAELRAAAAAGPDGATAGTTAGTTETGTTETGTTEPGATEPEDGTGRPDPGVAGDPAEAGERVERV